MSDIVSVIIPVYNSEKYLRYCLDSVVNQSYKDIEIIIVDDGSRDNSSVITDEYAKRYSNIVVYHNVNHGVSYSRNFGISKASGKYILFHDSDDWLKENAVELLVKAIGEDDIACGAIEEIWPHANVLVHMPEGRFIKSDPNNRFIDVLFNMHETSCAKLYLRDVILENDIKFDSEIKNGEDAKFIHDYFYVCNSVSCISDTVDCYNKLENNTSVTKFYKELACWREKEAISRFKAYESWCFDASDYISKRSVLYYSDIFDTYLGSDVPINEYQSIIIDALEYFNGYIKKSDYKICDIDQNVVRNLIVHNPDELLEIYRYKNKKNIMHKIMRIMQDVLRSIRQRKYIH